MDFITKYPAEILILLFLIITFLLSGIEKITDWKGNVSFIKEHFKESPLKNSVPLLLVIVLVTELVASFLMIYGIYEIISEGKIFFALVGIELSALTLLFLLIGQRLAKDYQGAMSLGVYFIITILGLIILTY